MKILSAIIKTLLAMVLIAFISAIIVFVLAIFMPEQVQNAINIVLNLIKGGI